MASLAELKNERRIESLEQRVERLEAFAAKQEIKEQKKDDTKESIKQSGKPKYGRKTEADGQSTKS